MKEQNQGKICTITINIIVVMWIVDIATRAELWHEGAIRREYVILPMEDHELRLSVSGRVPGSTSRKEPWSSRRGGGGRSIGPKWGRAMGSEYQNERTPFSHKLQDNAMPDRYSHRTLTLPQQWQTTFKQEVTACERRAGPEEAGFDIDEFGRGPFSSESRLRQASVPAYSHSRLNCF